MIVCTNEVEGTKKVDLASIRKVLQREMETREVDNHLSQHWKKLGMEHLEKNDFRTSMVCLQLANHFNPLDVETEISIAFTILKLDGLDSYLDYLQQLLYRSRMFNYQSDVDQLIWANLLSIASEYFDHTDAIYSMGLSKNKSTDDIIGSLIKLYDLRIHNPLTWVFLSNQFLHLKPEIADTMLENSIALDPFLYEFSQS